MGGIQKKERKENQIGKEELYKRPARLQSCACKTGAGKQANNQLTVAASLINREQPYFTMEQAAKTN